MSGISLPALFLFAYNYLIWDSTKRDIPFHFGWRGMEQLTSYLSCACSKTEIGFRLHGSDTISGLFDSLPSLQCPWLSDQGTVNVTHCYHLNLPQVTVISTRRTGLHRKLCSLSVIWRVSFPSWCHRLAGKGNYACPKMSFFFSSVYSLK